jgi:hypothetical protein
MASGHTPYADLKRRCEAFARYEKIFRARRVLVYISNYYFRQTILVWEYCTD